MSQKRFRTGHLNDIVKQEHRTWLIFPVIMGVLLLRYGWEIFAVSAGKNILPNTMGFLVIACLLALVLGCIPFYFRRAKLLGAKKELLSNCTFITMQDLDYYRDKLTGLTPGEISLLEDLSLETEKDVSACILRYEYLWVLRETADGYERGNAKPGALESLRESDRYLLEKLLDGTWKRNAQTWKDKVIEEAQADGFLTKKKGFSLSKMDVHAKEITLIWLLLLIVCILLIASGQVESAMQGYKDAPTLPVPDWVFWFGRQQNWMLTCLNNIRGSTSEIEVIMNTPQLLPTMIVCFSVYVLFFLLFLAPFLYVKMQQNRVQERVDYGRTEKGNEYAEYIWGMKNFIHDYSYLNEADKDALALWDDYLIYAVVLEENTQIRQEIMAHGNYGKRTVAE